MKKITQHSPIFMLLIAVVFSVFYGCEKNPMDNFKIIVSPALFEYTASIRIIDAADSTVPPNLKIVLNPENEGDLYDILGKNKLAISDNGYIQVGLKPSIKPGADNPVEIRFQLQADNYISENYSLVYHLGQYSINKTFTLMNKSNLPRGVSYTHVTAAVSNGAMAMDLNINLGGGKGGMALKSAAVNEVNKATIKAGTKLWYWNYDKNLPGLNKWVKSEVMESGQLDVNAFFYQWNRQYNYCYTWFENGYISDKGILKVIPAKSAFCNVGGWDYYFTLNGKYVWPEDDTEPSATLQLKLPKSGLNLNTGNLYQIGDVINIYNYKWNYGYIGEEVIFELLSSETLSETSDVDPDYFILKTIHVNSVNNIVIGGIIPLVTFDKGPEVKLEVRNTPANMENPFFPVDQYLYKSFQYGNQYYDYDFGHWFGNANENADPYFSYFKFISGTYIQKVVYPVSEIIQNTVNTSIYNQWGVSTIYVGQQGGPNPLSLTIPVYDTQFTTINFSVKCGDQIIQPSFYYQVREVSNPYDKWSKWYYGGYIINGSISSYLLKVGGAYEFKVDYEGGTIMVIDTIKTLNTEIVIDDDSFCTF